jgi:hypothetical protein
MRRRRHRAQRSWSSRRIAAVVSAVVVVAGLGIGTGMSYAGQSTEAAGPNSNCSLVVPPNPLSAKGLATPYQLVATTGRQGACHEADAAQAAFVQATVVDPATGKVSVYDPLVIDQGTKPAVAPVVPALPKNAAVGIWFGFNGDNLTLKNAQGSLRAGACVNGLGNSIFTQFAYCNAPGFFAAANAAIKAGKLKVPPLGRGKDGNACPTTRDFTIVDQDQSDNVTSAYLIRGNKVAQDTAANVAKLPNATVQVNGSDNLLLVQFVDQAVGCKPFEAPDLADNGTMTTSLGLDELQAAAAQGNPVALVPPNDPMAEVNGNGNLAKLNLYRQGVDMLPLRQAGNLAATYCQSMVDLQPKRLQQDRNLTQQVASPDPGAGNSLFTFLAQRLSASFGNLGCGELIKTGDPVKLTVKNGVAVDASFVGLGGNGGGGKGSGNGANGGRPQGGGAAPTPTATATSKPTATPSARPTATSTSKPTATSTSKPTATSTATAGGATVKDAFTPTASATSHRTTTSPTAGHAVATTHTAAAVRPAAVVRPTATATRQPRSAGETQGGGTSTQTGETGAPAGGGATSPSTGSYVAGDGVVGSSVPAPTATTVEQSRLAAGEVPVTKNSGFLSTVGAKAPALIAGSVAGGVVLMLVVAFFGPAARRRRSGDPSY